MKRIVFILSLILLDLCCFSQDIIYFKDRSTQKAKILEVNIDKVRFKKNEMDNGPTYEVLKNDIIKIQYSNGYIDHFVQTPDTLIKKSIEKHKHHDTESFNKLREQAKTWVVFFNIKSREIIWATRVTGDCKHMEYTAHWGSGIVDGFKEFIRVQYR
jgi:hypothetical protein